MTDTLSRIEAIVFPVAITTEELSKAQGEDDELTRLLQSPGSSSLNLKGLRKDGTDALVYYNVSNGNIRPFVPRLLRRRIFANAHNCLPCQRNKMSRHVKNTPQHIAMPSERFHHVHIDIVVLGCSASVRRPLLLLTAEHSSRANELHFRNSSL